MKNSIILISIFFIVIFYKNFSETSDFKSIFILKKKDLESHKTLDASFFNKKKDKIIIFIHGTYSLNLDHLFKLTYYKIFRKRKALRRILHEKKIKRYKDSLETQRSICGDKEGLNKISGKTISRYVYDYVFTFLQDDFASFFQNSSLQYYSFNWSGVLDEESRCESSRQLYFALKALKKDFPDSEIIIVAYSHGGNVALNIKNILSEYEDNEFFIDLLILLATPLNTQSQVNAQGECFKLILNFYSQKDLYQILDIFFGFPFIGREISVGHNYINCNVKYISYNKKTKKYKIKSPHHIQFGSYDAEYTSPPIHKFLGKILESIFLQSKFKLTSRLKVFIKKM